MPVFPHPPVCQTPEPALARGTAGKEACPSFHFQLLLFKKINVLQGTYMFIDSASEVDPKQPSGNTERLLT